MSFPPAPVRFRTIEDADLAAVAELLSEGFRLRPKAYWLRGLKRHADRERPANTPAYGYMIESASRPVGAILMLFSDVDLPEGKVTRCNLSSWYVKPEFRNFSSLLVTRATKDKSVTYFNVSPAPNTWRTVEAQGFSMYCRGQMYTLPVFNAPVKGTVVERFDAAVHRHLPEYELMRTHAALGCTCVVVTHQERQHPFVFSRGRMFHRLLPCHRLVFGRDGDFVRFAGNLGRSLLWSGTPLVVVGADQPIAELIGHFTDHDGRRYAKGPHQPAKTDLAFTEFVFF